MTTLNFFLKWINTWLPIALYGFTTLKLSMSTFMSKTSMVKKKHRIHERSTLNGDINKDLISHICSHLHFSDWTVKRHVQTIKNRIIYFWRMKWIILLSFEEDDPKDMTKSSPMSWTQPVRGLLTLTLFLEWVVCQPFPQ